MDIGFVGLGKLGFPVAVAIASRGHTVRGWDLNPAIQRSVRKRHAVDTEAEMGELLERSSVELLPLEALVEASEVVFIAVQTPHESSLDGATPLPDYRRDFDYSHLTAAVSSLAHAAAAQRKSLTVAVVSTVLPGTIQRQLTPLLGDRAALAYTPSFTAMGTTIRDFLAPEFVLIGADGGPSAPQAELLARFYRTLHDRPLLQTDVSTAELIKVAYNAFIGQKIVFANAMMEISHKLGANVDELSAALALATDRIVSPRYLRGGMGDGGPCHPRDNVALSWLSRELRLSHDIFNDVMQARQDQTGWLADLIEEQAGGLPVVILGKAFKPLSDLTDGSPALLLASILRARGVCVAHHDSHVDPQAPSPDQQSPSLFFIATKHPEYERMDFPAGSVVLDPWGYIPDRDAVTVTRIGRP